MNKRICVICFRLPPEFSGATLQFFKIAKQLRLIGWDSIFIAPSYDKKLDSTTVYEGFQGLRVFPDSADSAFIMKIMRKLFFLRKQFDVIYANSFFDELWTVFYLVIFSKIFNKTVIIELNMDMFPKDQLCVRNRKFKKLQLFVARYADAYFSVSSAITDSFIKEYPSLRHKIKTVFLGVDTNKFAPLANVEARTILRKKISLPVDRQVVMACGEISRRKGVDFLIDVWEGVLKELPHAVLVVIGPYSTDATLEEGRFAINLMQRVKQYKNLHESVVFLGKTNNVSEYMQASDIFITTARQEGSPNVIREAMSSGLPVVALHLPGITTDMIEHGVNGFIVDSKDYDKLRNWSDGKIQDEQAETIMVSSIVNILKDKELAGTISLQARQTIKSKFSIESNADNILHFLHHNSEGK